jgi:heptosyltransferase-2
MLRQQNIVIVKNRALGDSVMGLGAVSYLRSLFPQKKIIYAVPKWIAPLYNETKTSADIIYPLSLNSLRDIFKVYLDFKKLKVDHIHEMQQSGRGRKFFKLIAFFLGIPYTAHNHHLLIGDKVLDQGIKKPLIQRDLDGIYSFMGSGNVPDYINYEPRFIFDDVITIKPTIIFGVVATRQTKMWPLENFIKLAELINFNFPNMEIVIPLSKSETDIKIKSQLIELGLPNNCNIVQWSLSELPKMFRAASFYLGNDTGLKHIAIASGVKTFTIFGPEPTNEWHPYNELKHPAFYFENLSCRTRNSHFCNLSVCDLQTDNMLCMKSFSPELIFKSIQATIKLN